MRQDVAIAVVCTRFAEPSRLVYRSSTESDFLPGYPVLEPSRPLPRVCARHGRPAEEHEVGDVRFHDSLRGGLVQSRFISTWFATLINFGTPPPTTMKVLAEWPLCPRCVQRSRLLRVLAAVLALSGAFGIVAVWTASQAGATAETLKPFALGLIPGWFPFGLMIAGYLYARSGASVRIRRIEHRSRIVVRAHPDFAAAIDAQNDISSDLR